MSDKTFNKNQRLTGKKVVSEIFAKKDQVSAFPVKGFYDIKSKAETNGESFLRFGISVPKKKFKRAVDRNHIKRLVKEAIRLNKTFLTESVYNQKIGVNIMVICYFDEIPDYITVEEKIKSLLDRLGKRLESNEQD